MKHQFLLIVLLSSIPFFIISNLLTLNMTILADKQLRTQLEETTKRLYITFTALLRTNIKTYLRSKTEAGADIVYQIINDPDLSELSLEQKKQAAAAELLSLQVGQNGYFYALDSKGVMVFHPDNNLVDRNLHDISPGPEQLEMKNGYLEYIWQNTYETQPEKKALYMTYIPEFDWILSATSYRDEFTDMIDSKAIQETVSAIKFGESGYSYVVDRESGVIAHPLFQQASENKILLENDFKGIIDQLFRIKEGFITYEWKEDETARSRKKIVYGKYIEDFDWVVGTAIYLDEVNRRIINSFLINAIIALIIASVLFFIVRRAGRNIGNPISDIYRTLEAAIGGDLSIRTSPSGPDEINVLGKNLNIFISTLESRTLSLEATIREKDFLLQEIQHRVKNNLQTIISLLSLQADFSESYETQQTLLRTRNRISVMALVYDQMLYSINDFSNDEIDLAEFLNNYTDSIVSTAILDYSNLNLSCDFDAVNIERNSAICLGLILNEMLSHSISKIINYQSEIAIRISVKQMENADLIFTIEDNLSSFSKIKWNRDENKIAFILVEALSQQLSGIASRHQNHETFSYQIRFPINTRIKPV